MDSLFILPWPTFTGQFCVRRTRAYSHSCATVIFSHTVSSCLCYKICQIHVASGMPVQFAFVLILSYLTNGRIILVLPDLLKDDGYINTKQRNQMPCNVLPCIIYFLAFTFKMAKSLGHCLLVSHMIVKRIKGNIEHGKHISFRFKDVVSLPSSDVALWAPSPVTLANFQKDLSHSSPSYPLFLINSAVRYFWHHSHYHGVTHYEVTVSRLFTKGPKRRQ